MKKDKLYTVRGDHPIFARPDKTDLTKEVAQGYAIYLKALGFENVNIVPQRSIENETIKS